MYLEGVQPDKCNGSVMLRFRSVDKDDEVEHGGSKAAVETWSKTRKRKLVILRLTIISQIRLVRSKAFAKPFHPLLWPF